MRIPASEGTLAARLPAEFAGVPYRAGRFPGAPDVVGIGGGANCQLYAYAVLAHFGLFIPPVRSSELWTDGRLRTITGEPQALDLMFYGQSTDPYGAHLGVIVGRDAVLHLCAEVGHPVVWNAGEFADRDRYRVRIGATATARPDPLSTQAQAYPTLTRLRRPDAVGACSTRCASISAIRSADPLCADLERRAGPRHALRGGALRGGFWPD